MTPATTPTKTIAQSKTLWGILLLVLPSLLARAGVQVDEAEVQHALDAALELAGVILGVWGRFTATRALRAPRLRGQGLLFVAVTVTPFVPVLVIGGATAIVQTACHSPAAAKTLLATGESVKAAMNIYGELYRMEPTPLTPDEIARVRREFARFQLAYNQAVAAVEQDLKQMTPAAVAQLAVDIIETIGQLRGKYTP